MLDPEYLRKVTDELENYFYDLETDILSDIAERIRLNAGKMTSTAQYQLEQLKALGVVDDRVNSYLSKALKKSNKEVEKIISESAYKSVEADNVIFKEACEKKLIASFSYNKNDFKDLIAKGVAATTKDIKNICNTTAKTSRQKLTSAMNMAYLQVSSGAFSPEQAVENAVSQLVKEGLDWIDYKSGTHRHLDTSIRQALRTSINQTALKCQDQNFEALGGNLVEVSSHLGARPSHAQWQGKIYWRREKYKNYSNFEEATGYGTVTGLGGVNCRHSFFPYFPGLSTKSFEHYSQKENEELYNLQQEQRYNERKIREWKRRQKVKSSAGLDTSKESAKVREWSQRNKKLIDSDSGLKRNYGRERVYAKSSFSSGLGANNNFSSIPKHQKFEIIERIDYNNYDEVERVFKEYEKFAEGKDIETACIITQSGDVFRCYGDKTHVYPDFDLGDKLIGSKVSHYHVSDETEFSFSNDDLQLFQKYNLNELYGFDYKYKYVLSKKFTTNADDFDFFDFMDFEKIRHLRIAEKAIKLGIGYRRKKR